MKSLLAIILIGVASSAYAVDPKLEEACWTKLKTTIPKGSKVVSIGNRRGTHDDDIRFETVTADGTKTSICKVGGRGALEIVSVPKTTTQQERAKALAKAGDDANLKRFK